LRRPSGLAGPSPERRRPGPGPDPLQVQPSGRPDPAGRRRPRFAALPVMKETRMTFPVRTLLLTAAVAASLAACQRRDDKAETPPPAPVAAVPPTPATAGAPMTYDSKNSFATVKLTLPDAIKDKPDLHAPLYAAA